MGYATFDYYRTVFLGEEITDDVTFARAEREASAYIDRITHGNASGNITDAVKDATCAVAEVVAKQAHDEESTVSGESVGNHSRSYTKVSVSREEREREKLQMAELYLSRTGLLYRGLR